MKKFRVTVEGKSYEVLVESLEDAGEPGPAPATQPRPVAPAPLAAEPVAPAAASPASEPVPSGAVPSPLSGKVVAVAVAPGATVAAGAEIATIEAMKMNTHIFAPKAGRVTAVFVKPGDGVEEGTLLMQID
jgi:biotin carboxyl carrier protein